MSLLPDYAHQATTYDRTRAASRTVLARLRGALTGAPGRRLADVGGGTGNYAQALAREGWEPVVIDRSAEMLAFAARKGLAAETGVAEDLPFPDESFDAAMLVSMLHHVADPAAALSESRRILRASGRMAVMVFAREDIHLGNALVAADLSADDPDLLPYLGYVRTAGNGYRSSEVPLGNGVEVSVRAIAADDRTGD